MQNLFQQALSKKNADRPPVWFMRQAGRYHHHYQALRRKHGFVELCKDADLATQVTLGPMEDFDFDAAILFSDLLFPLESLGFGLTYDPAPQLSFLIQSKEDLKKIQTPDISSLFFQAQALKKIRQQLSQKFFSSKGLIGFVGGFYTLYCYATQGSHQNKTAVPDSLFGDCFDPFCEALFDLLLENMLLQAEHVDCLAVMDTALGDISWNCTKSAVFPWMKRLFFAFAQRSSVPVLFYSKNTGMKHFELFSDLPIAGIGIDWKTPLALVLDAFSERFVIQGNFDPHLLASKDALSHITHFFDPIIKLPQEKRQGWICGLGHGVLKTTPEQHVRDFLSYQKKVFG